MKARKLSALLLVLVLGTGLVPVSAASNTSTVGDNSFPEKFDLRDYGVVTPVKTQNPWLSCWAFGGIAAAESSLLTSMGLTCEEYKELSGEEFDLSEKHLAWFSKYKISELTNSSQAGEGLWSFGQDDDPLLAYSVGGNNLYTTTLFATGVGPVPESCFPYQGAEGLTFCQYLAKYPDRVKAEAVKQIEAMPGLASSGITLQQLFDQKDEQADTLSRLVEQFQAANVLDDSITVETLTYEELEDACVKWIYGGYISAEEAGNGCFSQFDDWTIPETGEDGSPNRDLYAGFTLVDGNILPPLTIIEQDGDKRVWTAVNDAGTEAVKSELLKGRGVVVSFCADQAMPGDPIKENSYINTKTWAHYTYDDVSSNHTVCIVGWDDTYSKENFLEGHQPPSDGAWIVKNSWGSETEYITLDDGTTVGKNAWGIPDEEGKATGYFYLSYYDKSINDAESMAFNCDLYKAGGVMDVWAYDYMPAFLTNVGYNQKIQDENVIKTANVFTNNTDKEYAVCAVSTKTASHRARVEYILYRLGEDARNPEDGELIGKRVAYYDYAGFHRESLNGSVPIKPGERIAVVAIETVTDKNGEKKYEFAANQATSQNQSMTPYYGIAVVNKGESFIFRDGEWTDWSEYDDKYSDALYAEMSRQGITDVSEAIVTDNFSIKLYVVTDA